MVFKNRHLCILIIPLFLCSSCLYSRTAAPRFSLKKTIKINSGSVILKIKGQINENLYMYSPIYVPDRTLKDPVNVYDNPLINEGSISKNEIKNLSAGEEYTFSVLPTEVVAINFTSLDGNDVEISVFEYGKEKKYTLEGTNRLGLFLAFQNR